jgi:hypothetical protein
MESDETAAGEFPDALSEEWFGRALDKGRPETREDAIVAGKGTQVSSTKDRERLSARHESVDGVFEKRIMVEPVRR